MQIRRGIAGLKRAPQYPRCASRKWYLLRRRVGTDGAQSSVGDTVEVCRRKVRDRHLAPTAVAAAVNRPTGVAAFAGGAEAGKAISDRQLEATGTCEAL